MNRSGSKIGKRMAKELGGIYRGFNKQQKALLKLIKELRRKITQKDAKILLEWGEEYGLESLNHIDSRHWLDGRPHIKIGPYRHIPVNRD